MEEQLELPIERQLIPLDDVVKEYVLKVLNSTETQTKAAEILKISARTIRNYLDRWDIKYDRESVEKFSKKYN